MSDGAWVAILFGALAAVKVVDWLIYGRRGKR